MPASKKRNESGGDLSCRARCFSFFLFLPRFAIKQRRFRVVSLPARYRIDSRALLDYVISSTNFVVSSSVRIVIAH